MRITLAVAALLTLAACSSSVTHDGRTVRGNVIVSDHQPPIRIEISRDFQYAGRVPFRIRDVAAGDRYVFVNAVGKRVKRMFVLQFEGYLPNIAHTYNYDFTNARNMGGYKWRHNIGWYSDKALRAEGQGNEAAAMHDWLAAEGWIVDDELFMSRFLTLGDETRKNELILFYYENVRDHGLTVERLNADRSLADPVRKPLEERSLTAFRILGRR